MELLYNSLETYNTGIEACIQGREGKEQIGLKKSFTWQKIY